MRLMVLALLAATVLAACGHRGPLVPPEEVDREAPRATLSAGG